MVGLVATVALAGPLAWAQSQPTVLHRLRAMLGLIRPVSVGGSRGNTDQQLCVLSPWLQPGIGRPLPGAAEGSASSPGETVAVALTPSGAPPIATAAPVEEVLILRGGTLIWRGRASSSGPLANPLAWPLAPLKPGESVLLKLRGQKAAGGDFSVVELRRPSSSTAPAPAQADRDPAQALAALLQQGRQAEAMELLFQGDVDGYPQLRQWSQASLASGCSASVPR